MNRLTKKKQKAREQHKEDRLVELDKDFQNFQFAVQKKDRATQEHVKLLNLTKSDYQKLFVENEILKEKINTVGKERQIKKEKAIKKDNIK